MTVGLVWAQSRDGIVGRDGALPWHLPEDLAHFKRLTTGSVVVMGRRTWESLPARWRPLPGRRNVVLSRDRAYPAPGATVLHDVAAVLAAYPDCWVIGGGAVWAAFLDIAATAVVTTVDVDVAGDVRAPVLDGSWEPVERSPATGWAESTTGLWYAVTRYRRCRPA